MTMPELPAVDVDVVGCEVLVEPEEVDEPEEPLLVEVCEEEVPSAVVVLLEGFAPYRKTTATTMITTTASAERAKIARRRAVALRLRLEDV
jgi:hypothetical protein